MAEYSFEVHRRYLIVRGIDTTLEASWSQARIPATPTPGTVSVRRPNGTMVVDGAAFSVSNDVASVTVDAADTTSLNLEQGWLVIWQPTMPDGSAPEYVQEAALVRYLLYPPAGEADLYRRVSRLNPGHPAPIAQSLDLQAKLEEAWWDIESMLYDAGRRPELVMTSSQFRRPHVLLSLAMIFEDLAMTQPDLYRDRALEYRDQFNEVWQSLSFTYDADEDGYADGGATPVRTGAEASVWLASRE